jgi:phage terminase large subunit GpA-like protein
LSVSQWADEHRFLSRVSAGESGKWRTARTPYLAAIMDAFTDDSIERIIFVKAGQVGGTESLLNMLGWVIHVSPGPVLLVQPTVELARRFSKQRLRSLIESTPALRDRVSSPRERDSGNTILTKEFRHGVLICTGANSGVGLRSAPAKNIFCDEVDAFPASASGAAGTAGAVEEGDPVDLAIKRSETFPDRKIVLISTPTVEGSSRISEAFAESDQRFFWVPCVHCGEFQTLKWSGVIWPEHRPAEAFYQCEHCQMKIEDHHKSKMLELGEWRASAAGDGDTRGFHLNGLYSPWVTWAKVAKDFLRAKVSPERLRTFTNTVLAEVWKEQHDKQMPADDLFSRSEPYSADPLPAGVALITAGVDVQADRLEGEIVGWGRDEESWSLGYYVLMGDTSRADVWAQLDALLRMSFNHPYGIALPISAACVDAGFQQTTVTQFCHERIGRRVFATKGAAGQRPAWPRAITHTNSGAPLWIIGADALKESVYARLKITDVGPGYCHFPAGRDLAYFEQLTAERIVLRYHKGFQVREWTKRPGQRNEALDARCLSYAALQALTTSGVRLNSYAGQVERMKTEARSPQQQQQRRPIRARLSGLE